MNSELCLWLAESCVCSGPRTKPKELEEIGIHARTIEQDLQTDSGNSNGSTYKIKQLFNKHGYNLAILRGHVKGNLPIYTILKNRKFTRLKRLLVQEILRD